MALLKHSPVAAALAALLAAACGPDAVTNVAFDDQSFDAGVEGSGTGVFTGNPDFLPEINGTWLVNSQPSTCVIFVSTFELLNRTTYIVETAVDPFGTLVETWTACEIDLTPVLNQASTVSPALYETAFPYTTTRGLSGGADLGDSYGSGAVAELWGLDMDDPAADTFPTEADDPRIIDMDGDGNPGITLNINDTCEAYIVQRTTNHFAGTFVAADRIEGTITSSTKQLVLGASAGLCGTQYETVSNDAYSAFTRVRIDGRGDSRNWDADGDGRVTCDELPGTVAEVLAELEIEVRQPDNEVCGGRN